MAEDSRIPASSNTVDATNPSDSDNSLVTAKDGDRSTLESSLLSLSFKQSQVDFILKNREQYLKNPRILSIKFKISESKASEVIEILKSAKSDNTETEMTQAVMEKIKACLVEYPDMNHEEIALLCELDERLIAKYFEILPLNEDQKYFIEERYNKDISISDISNLLKIGINKVREYVEATFVTFSGEEGMEVLDIIHKHFSPIPIPSLREKIRSKNLKLQDQLCCKLPRKSREDFEFLKQYFRKYDESDKFLKCDLNLSMDDITKIKQSSGDDVEQLSSKLNKVESIIYDYINQYAVYHIENANSAEIQAKQISEIALSFGTTKFSFDNYRIIITNSFDEIISQIENATECKGTMALIQLLPLVFYYLKCSLPFEDIARIIANLSDITLTTHDVFHLVFQLSDPVLRGLCIEHYSFSNAVPLYYPKLSVGNSTNTKFEVCKELWYCLGRYHSLISFGLGRASWNAVGKSSLLDMIFETDFVKGSPQGSAFHFRSIDIQLTKNLYGEFDRSDLEHWAYIDCHGYSDSKVIHFMCSRLDLALIHVSYHDYENNRSALNKELSLFEGKLRHVYLLIRDSECVEVSVSSEITADRSKTVVFIPDLTKKDVKLHSIVKSLKEIGYEILHLDIDQPKQIQSEFIEGILLDLDIEIVHEIQKENQLIQQITHHIEKTAGDKIDFNFLNFYPHYVEYMSLYHKASYETDQSVINKLNIDCARLEAKMEHTPLGEIVVYFNLILQRENSSLVLWKLLRELSHLSKRFTEKGGVMDSLKEQKNDKYTLEIIWREALLSQKYGRNTDVGQKDYGNFLISNFSKHVESGEAFELIDGDNLRFFNKDIDELLSSFYLKHGEMLEKINKDRSIKLKHAPIVVSIFGPQSSGKSTLLNYCFGCKFLTSAGRCTRGIYGSLSKLDRPVNLSQSFLILDTEGLDAIERENIKDTSVIHFDRTMVLFCLSVSQVVIINVRGGDIGSEMQNLLQICAYSLNRLKVSKVKAPKIFFVLNQQADPDPSKHLDSINLLMEKLNSECDLMETEGMKISDLIQVSRDNLFILPSAFNSQQMNKPGAKLFDSNVIKLSPTIAFAEQCAKLRVAIVDQLDRMPQDDRASFQTMSEWMEMAGVIWDTIVKYQDIVKFKNLEELICSKKLDKIVTDLTDKYIYSNQGELTNLANELCEEIDHVKSYLDPETILSKYMFKFDEVFMTYQDCCMKEFSVRCREDPRLEKMEQICTETASNLGRLIHVVRKQYEDQLKFQIRQVLTEIKLSASMKNFQDVIIKNVDKYLEYSIEEQKKAFEETWDETFAFEDKEEETRECKENLSNLYSIFKIENNAMEHKLKVIEIFENYNFNMDEAIQSLKSDILYRFKKVETLKQSDQFIYPINSFHIPLKEMIPYNGRSKYGYLCQETLYEIEHTGDSTLACYLQALYTSNIAQYCGNPIGASEDEAVFNLQKYASNHGRKRLKLKPWVPLECKSLLKYSSGLFNHPDITWKDSKKTQITILASRLRCPDNTGMSSWDIFINDISSDVLRLLETNPDVTHAVVKQIINVFKFRIRLMNYEIGYIHAGLSNTAERMLSTFVFAFAFKFLWEKKALIRRANKEKKDAQKPGHLKYFLLKIKNRKMVRGMWNRDTMAESDRTLSQKYAQDYLAAVKRSLITSEQQNSLNIFFQDRKKSFSHDSLLSLAHDRIFKELSTDPDSQVTDVTNFVVQFFCNKTELFKSIFQEKWKELKEILYTIIFENISRGFEEKISNLRSTLSELISRLEIVAENVNLRAFDSDSNFEIAQLGTSEKVEMKEAPFKAMANYLKMYLDPSVKPEDFIKYHLEVFVVDSFKVKKSDTYTLCCKPTEPALDEDSFDKLVKTGMFNATELLFNIFEYVKQFISIIENYHIILEQEEFQEMIEYLKCEFEKNAIGCPSQCPSCGKFCDREIHPNDGKCQIKTGHQISSMGGKVWKLDKDRTAVLFMCDDYTDSTSVIMPSGHMQWGEFKGKCGSEWDWTLPPVSKQLSNHDTMKKIWNKFGQGILDYYYVTEKTQITFVPYISIGKLRSDSNSLKFSICFVIDGTGSMKLDISRVRLSVEKLIRKFASKGNSTEFRVVIYRDHCDTNVIETYPEGVEFTQQHSSIDGFLQGVVTTGGGDFPEAMLDGLATAATKSDWACTPQVRNKIIHIFDSPPHGDFPDYKFHSSYSEKGNCCCCYSGCQFDWERDVWAKFREFNIDYFGINTNSSKWNSYTDVYRSLRTTAMEYYHWIYIDKVMSRFQSKMKAELGHLCGDFQTVGKEVVDDAILQIFVDLKK